MALSFFKQRDIYNIPEEFIKDVEAESLPEELIEEEVEPEDAQSDKDFLKISSNYYAGTPIV